MSLDLTIRSANPLRFRATCIASRASMPVLAQRHFHSPLPAKHVRPLTRPPRNHLHTTITIHFKDGHHATN